MIWRVVSRHAELSAAPLTVTPAEAYAMFDGLFQYALLRHLAGRPGAFDDLRVRALAMLRHIDCCAPAARSWRPHSTSPVY